MTSIISPVIHFRHELATAKRYATGALGNVSMPPNALPIIDPKIAAVAQARLAVAALDRSLTVDTMVPTGATDAARLARSELLQGMVAIENGHPSIMPTRGHFTSALNWINVAENYVRF